MTTLRLPPSVYKGIRAHGEQTYPHECCGALLGRPSAQGWQVHAAVPARQHPHRFSPQPLPDRPIPTGPHRARRPPSGSRHRRLLPLPPRPPRAMVGHRSGRGSLARLLLRHHFCRPGQSRRHQRLPPRRHRRRRQTLPAAVHPCRGIEHRFGTRARLKNSEVCFPMTIFIPSALRPYADGEGAIDLHAATVAQAPRRAHPGSPPTCANTSSAKRANSAHSLTST